MVKAKIDSKERAMLRAIWLFVKEHWVCILVGLFVLFCLFSLWFSKTELEGFWSSLSMTDKLLVAILMVLFFKK